MREAEFLNLIQNTLSDSGYIGDDCANLDDEKLFVTQDTMVEGVHFTRSLTSAYLLGKKIIAVNVSDLCAALAKPKYALVSVSLPKNIKKKFVESLYTGIDVAASKYGLKIVGGDITGSTKIMISVCMIGSATNRKYPPAIARKYAFPGDVVTYCGYAGASALGLAQLKVKAHYYSPFVQAHLEPQPQYEASRQLVQVKADRVAAMDTSDGLADAIYKVSLASGVIMDIDGKLIPTMHGFHKTCPQFGLNPEDTIMFGGEDFGLLAVMNKSLYSQLNHELFVKIGEVLRTDRCPVSTVSFGSKVYRLDAETMDKYSFDHFSENNSETSTQKTKASKKTK